MWRTGRGAPALSSSTFDAASIYVAHRLTAAGRRAFLRAADAGATLVCDADGGAITAVDADATALMHRSGSLRRGDRDGAPPRPARPRADSPPRQRTGLQNYPDLDQPGRCAPTTATTSPAWARSRPPVDPGNRFRVTQGVTAA